MKKEELKEFIEGTIIPNKIKGITATMLKEVLLEVADSLGEGGEGGGGYTFWCNFDAEIFNQPDFYAGLVDSNLLTTEQLEHNKQCFDKIIEEVNNGKPMPFISADIMSVSESGSGVDFRYNHPLLSAIVMDSESDVFAIGDFVGFPYIVSASVVWGQEGVITKDGYCVIFH